MHEDTIIQKLMFIGLSSYEARCYIALLKNHPANPYQISKLAGIPTAKIYEVVDRLRERGIITEIEGNDPGYIPQNPDVVLTEWREKYNSTFDMLNTDLNQIMIHKPHHAVWNFEGLDEVVGRGRRLITSAKAHISLLAPGVFFGQVAESLIAAQATGLDLRLIVNGGSLDIEGLAVIYIDSAWDRKNSPALTALSVDGEKALLAFDFEMNRGNQGAYTDNPAIARLIQEHIADKLFLDQVLGDHLIKWGYAD